MDNATAEYNFISNFFTTDIFMALESQAHNSPYPPAPLPFPDNGDSQSKPESDSGEDQVDIATETYSRLQREGTKAEQANSDAIWKQVLDPVLEYCQVRVFFRASFYESSSSIFIQSFLRSVLDPMPPVITLLTMIRLTEDVVAEIRQRKCVPLEVFVFGLVMQMWPMFQTAMTQHCESLKKLADGSGGYFTKSVAITDASLATVSSHRLQYYPHSIFNLDLLSVHCGLSLLRIYHSTTGRNNHFLQVRHGLSLWCNHDLPALFSLSRMRQELVNVITKHIERVGKDWVKKAELQSTVCEGLLQGLRVH
jgi:hypothetical protein